MKTKEREKIELDVREIVIAAQENSGLKTQRELANHLDVTVATVSAWMCDRARPEWNRLQKLLDLAKIKLVNYDMVSIAISGTIPLIEFPKSKQGQCNPKLISHRKIFIDGNFKSDFAINYDLDFMQPTIPPKSIVLCRKIKKQNLNDLEGEIFFIYLRGEKEHLITRLYNPGKTIILVEDNAKNTPIKTTYPNIAIIGKCTTYICDLKENKKNIFSEKF